MKLEIQHNRIVAYAESYTESVALLETAGNFSTSIEPKSSDDAAVVGRKKHKKHMYVKECPECGSSFKGNIGLKTHMAKSHSVKGEWSIPKPKRGRAIEGRKRKTYVKLSKEDKKEVARMYYDKVPAKKIALQYGVSRASVINIVNRDRLSGRNTYGTLAEKFLATGSIGPTAKEYRRVDATEATVH